MQQTGTKFVGRALVALVAALVASAVLAGAATAGAAGSTPQSESGTVIAECQTIDEPGTYRLAGNVTDAPVDGCFEVTADGVTIDGSGYALATENATGAAVVVRGAEDVTVQGLVLEGWPTAVVLAVDTENARVLDNTVKNGIAGVRVGSASVASEVAGNEFANLTGPAVSVRSSGTVVADNTISDASAGISVADTNSVRVEGNEVTASNQSIAVLDAGNVTVRENVVRSGEGHAIRIVGEPLEPNAVPRFQAMSGPVLFSNLGAPEFGQFFTGTAETDQWDPRNHVVNNTVSGTNGHGVHVDGTTDAAVRDNELERNRDGVHVTGSTNVTVAANNVLQSGDDGVHLANASANTVANNTVLDSGDDGIYSVGSRNTLADNTVKRNGDDGIDAQSGTGVVVSGNVVANNSNDGIFFRNVDNGTIAENRAFQNVDDGIDLRNSHDNVVRSNEVYWNGHEGIVVRTDSTGNTVRGNSN